MRMSPSTAFAAAEPAEEQVTVPSEHLFAGAKVIRILHGDSVYTLRVTRQGKLLLTK